MDLGTSSVSAGDAAGGSDRPRVSAATLAGALDSLPDGVTVVDYDFTLLYLNAAAAAFLRLSEAKEKQSAAKRKVRTRARKSSKTK